MNTNFILKFNNYSEIFDFVFHFRIFTTDDFKITANEYDDKLLVKVEAEAFDGISMSSIIDGFKDKIGVDYIFTDLDDRYFLDIYDYDFKKAYSFKLGRDLTQARKIYNLFKNGYIACRDESEE